MKLKLIDTAKVIKKNVEAKNVREGKKLMSPNA